MRNLQFEQNYFDFIIDKSTIDAILCGECSFINVAKMLKEVDRVLKVGGIYMIVSYGQPENRIFHLERDYLNFETTIYTIKKDYHIEVDNEFDDIDNEKFEKVIILIFRYIMFMYVKKSKIAQKKITLFLVKS